MTGGLGGTPDDLTREAVAAAFEVPCREIGWLADDLRGRFSRRGLGDYAASLGLPAGEAEPIPNPLGGALGSSSGTSTSCPASPARWRRCSSSSPRGSPARRSPSWRRRYQTGEGQIGGDLGGSDRPPPGGHGGQLPALPRDRARGRCVLKSSDEAALADAVEFVQTALDGVAAVS